MFKLVSKSPNGVYCFLFLFILGPHVLIIIIILNIIVFLCVLSFFQTY